MINLILIFVDNVKNGITYRLCCMAGESDVFPIYCTLFRNLQMLDIYNLQAYICFLYTAHELQYVEF